MCVLCVWVYVNVLILRCIEVCVKVCVCVVRVGIYECDDSKVY